MGPGHRVATGSLRSRSTSAAARMMGSPRYLPKFPRERRSLIARAEGLEQIPEPERPDDVTGYTARDSAGQSNIFGRETKSYVGESVSGSGIRTGGYVLAAMAAGGALIFPNLYFKEDFSKPRYSEVVEFNKQFAKDLGIETSVAPALTGTMNDANSA